MTFRQLVYEKYGYNPAGFTVAKVNNNEFARYYSTSVSVEKLMSNEHGKHVLLYEINPSLHTRFPEDIDEYDSNNGVSNDYTRLIVNMG